MRARLLLTVLATATCLSLATLTSSRADTPPADWTQDDMNVCREYTYAHFLNLRGASGAADYDNASL